MELVIDGKKITARPGQTLLEVARRVGVHIPTLCSHESLESRGACRLCLVEISPSRSPNRKRIVASCVYPAEDGLVVQTQTEQIQQVRRTLVEMLLARCPNNEQVKKLAESFGVVATTFKTLDPQQQCILCGLCVRVCQDVIGAHAIGVYDRGTDKKVGTAYGLGSDRCIGCTACAQVCPTRCIEVVERDGMRIIPRWGVKLELVYCRVCGRPVSTKKHLEFVAKRTGQPWNVQALCEICRRDYYASRVSAEGYM
jgi:bidirectional [NiFe] hydrogenase diaphorase subunit